MIIADTGFFVALSNRADQYHVLALQVVDRLREPVITTYPVITEACYLIARDSSVGVECDFLETLVDGSIEIFGLQEQHIHRIIRLLRRYADLPMDFADASLVVLAEHLGHGRILTVDRRDFMTYRWHDTKPFENLLLVNP